MFKPITIFTILCDGCGKDLFEHTEFSGWGEKDYVNDEAKEDGWHLDEEKHYCHQCHTIDDNDEVILKPHAQV
jgi:hypothetical protein